MTQDCRSNNWYNIGDVSYRPIIDDMTWSFSRIDCFHDCPYRWFLKYIKGYKEKPKFYSSYGSFMHSLIEQFYKGEITKEDMQTKFLLEFSKEVQGTRPNAATVEKYIQAGIDYTKHFTPFSVEPIGIEEKVEFNIDGIPFVGYIDYHGVKDGEHYIIDNKSRAIKPRSNRRVPTLNDKELDKMLRQLYIYSAAIKQKYGKFPKVLCFNCFKTGVFIEEKFNEDAYKKAIEWAKKGIEDIKNAYDFYPNIDFFTCFYICGLSDECCYWQSR